MKFDNRLIKNIKLSIVISIHFSTRLKNMTNLKKKKNKNINTFFILGEYFFFTILEKG